MHGGGGTGPGGIKRARIEIIPLIDVVFFLLATFVLFMLALNKTPGINVKLPASSTSVPRDPSGAKTVSVTAEGTIAWEKEMVFLDEFLSRLTQYKQMESDPRILVNADKDAPFSQVVYVVDEVRKAGIPTIYIETRVFQSNGK